MSDQREVSRRGFIGATAAVSAAGVVAASRGGAEAWAVKPVNSFRSDFAQTPNRVWIGPACWANPMEDWRIAGGRLECTSSGEDRNVHLLTHDLSKDAAGSFEMSVRLGTDDPGKNGSAGFRFGVHDEINDYRGNCLFGANSAWNAVVRADRTLLLAGKTAKLDAKAELKDLTLKLSVKPAGDGHEATLTAFDAKGAKVGEVTATIPRAPGELYGNIALVTNIAPGKSGGTWWFADWTGSGTKLAHHPERAWGPILWAMHTLSDSRGDDGFVMKITAQLPPMGEKDAKQVSLHVKRDDAWKQIAEQGVEPDSCTATFRIARWDEKVDTPYRLTYGEAAYEGVVRRNPVDKPLVVGNLTCQFWQGFPYGPVATNVAAANPDMLFFSGDQIYEPNGGYGIIRNPADRAILNYLRKFYLFGWAFGDVMRDRPTVCLPDDHDVFHGNIWGEDGKAARRDDGADGGYVEPARMVNVVHRTNCGHHPDLFDPRPVQQGISVYYGDMVYGRVSFAILGDRQFKSAPMNVDTGTGRPDWVPDANFDVSTLDKPGLVLLGERQHRFLDHWVSDWRGADMKVVLSETVFANAATHHGNHDNFLLADLDSGGWPQTQRNRAVRSIRRAMPVHLNGDQHLSTLLQHGADEPRDGFWSFSAPAIASVYQRWWRADEIKRPHTDRPAHGLANTGRYRDGFGNLIYMYAVGNPPGSGKGAKDRYAWSEDRGGGFGLLRVNRAKRTYTFESYRFAIELPAGADDAARAKLQYPGFPHTITQRDNDGRAAVGKLSAITYDAAEQPVLKVTDESTGELVYAIRLTTQTVEPWVYADGVYTVALGDPDTDQWVTRKGQKPA